MARRRREEPVGPLAPRYVAPARPAGPPGEPPAGARPGARQAILESIRGGKARAYVPEKTAAGAPIPRAPLSAGESAEIHRIMREGKTTTGIGPVTGRKALIEAMGVERAGREQAAGRELQRDIVGTEAETRKVEAREKRLGMREAGLGAAQERGAAAVRGAEIEKEWRETQEEAQRKGMEVQAEAQVKVGELSTEAQKYIGLLTTQSQQYAVEAQERIAAESEKMQNYRAQLDAWARVTGSQQAAEAQRLAPMVESHANNVNAVNTMMQNIGMLSRDQAEQLMPILSAMALRAEQQSATLEQAMQTQAKTLPPPGAPQGRKLPDRDTFVERFMERTGKTEGEAIDSYNEMRAQVEGQTTAT